MLCSLKPPPLQFCEILCLRGARSSFIAFPAIDAPLPSGTENFRKAKPKTHRRGRTFAEHSAEARFGGDFHTAKRKTDCCGGTSARQSAKYFRKGFRMAKRRSIFLSRLSNGEAEKFFAARLLHGEVLKFFVRCFHMAKRKSLICGRARRAAEKHRGGTKRAAGAKKTPFLLRGIKEKTGFQFVTKLRYVCVFKSNLVIN